MRGDEPVIMATGITASSVFPACAGMSPDVHTGNRTRVGFPRTRGDEPMRTIGIECHPAFSPHARG